MQQCITVHTHTHTRDTDIGAHMNKHNILETQKRPVNNILLPWHRNGIPGSYKKDHTNIHRHIETLSHTHAQRTTHQLEASGRRGCLGNGGKEPWLFVLSIFSFGLKQRGIKTPGEGER